MSQHRCTVAYCRPVKCFQSIFPVFPSFFSFLILCIPGIFSLGKADTERSGRDLRFFFVFFRRKITKRLPGEGRHLPRPPKDRGSTVAWSLSFNELSHSNENSNEKNLRSNAVSQVVTLRSLILYQSFDWGSHKARRCHQCTTAALRCMLNLFLFMD